MNLYPLFANRRVELRAAESPRPMHVHDLAAHDTSTDKIPLTVV